MVDHRLRRGTIAVLEAGQDAERIHEAEAEAGAEEQQHAT